MEDWELETETYVEPELETVNTELVTRGTVLVCSKCGVHNHLRDGSCIKCDRQLI